jgi:hypothetical protein
MMTQHTTVQLTFQNHTCSQCTYFQNYQEPNGRGWCHLFEQAAKTYHQRTNDCDLHADKNPLDAPHARFGIESIVKIIDKDEHHSEWAAFIVINRQYNTGRYRSTEAYLSEPEWYYQLVNIEYEETFEPLWVAEDEICAFDESHNICTKDIF